MCGASCPAPKATGCPMSGALECPNDRYRHREQDLQSRLSARPDRAQPARYRFLQAFDAADDSGMLPGSAGDLFGHQSQRACAACRHHRRGRIAGAARPRPHHPLHQEGVDLARRQHLLRQDTHVLAGFHQLALHLPPSRIRAAQGGRPVRAALPRALDPHDDVGNSGARHSQRAALARGDEGTGPLRARRSLRPRQGQALEQGRAPAQAGGLEAVGFRHAAAARLPVAALVRGGGEGRARAVLHRDLEQTS